VGDVLVSLDALFSFSEAAAAAPKPHVCPVLHDKFVGIMMLDQVRHPCLEVLDGMSFIASVSFGRVRQSVSVCKKSAYTVCRCSSPSP
jgi:DNA mismatch repair ATPase MutS